MTDIEDDAWNRAGDLLLDSGLEGDAWMLARETLAMALLENAAARMIDSEVQMPPPEEEVLAYAHGAFSIICTKPHEDGAWFNYESWFTLQEVGRFYWMPLPDPPGDSMTDPHDWDRSDRNQLAALGHARDWPLDLSPFELEQRTHAALLADRVSREATEATLESLLATVQHMQACLERALHARKP